VRDAFAAPRKRVLFSHALNNCPPLLPPSSSRRSTGFVNCVDGFAGQPAVINGASNLFRDVLGDRGVHARSAVGTNALPLNVPVEIEAIVEVD